MPVESSQVPLRRVVELILQGEAYEAQTALKETLTQVDVQRSPHDVKHYIFGGALARRLSRPVAEETNLYLLDYDVPQIRLFNLLAHEVPVMSMMTSIVNRAIIELTREQDHVTVIDIGIGTGRQMVELLQTMAAMGRRPATIDIVGIEPSGWSLDLAGKNLRASADALGFQLEFHPIHNMVEYLSQDERRSLKEIGERPVINASCALHHIQDIDNHDVRDAVLYLLRSLEPTALLVAEPHSNHLDRDLLRRFDSCWAHFGLVFDLLDSLDIAQQERDALKVCFFGREISDILGNPDNLRTERHEPATAWLRRLERTGYTTRSLMSHATDLGHPAVGMQEHGGYLGLDFAGETLIAVMCAVPDVDAQVTDVLPPAARQRPLPEHRPFDVHVYLAALVAIARADHVIHERERPFIEGQARLFGVEPAELWTVQSLDTILSSDQPLSLRTREAILRDAVLLAMLDGEYVEEERAEALAIARRLGFDEDKLARTEALSQAYLPDGFSAAPSWFRQYWIVGNKQ